MVVVRMLYLWTMCVISIGKGSKTQEMSCTRLCNHTQQHSRTFFEFDVINREWERSKLAEEASALKHQKAAEALEDEGDAKENKDGDPEDESDAKGEDADDMGIDQAVIPIIPAVVQVDDATDIDIAKYLD